MARGVLGCTKDFTGKVDFSSSYAADIDGDGDVDLLSSDNCISLQGVCLGMIRWHENTDGKGSFGGQPYMISGDDLYYWVHADDLDADGDEDVLLAGLDGVFWYENTPLEAGDANHDGIFDELDIVHVLQAAKYLTSEPATFEQGDWNNDGVFDQLDIVARFTDRELLERVVIDAVFAATERT